VSKKNVTIRDVARAAGVSPGTVSRAINESPLVKEETRERVLQVVEELNYRPNIIARRLSTGKTLAIKVFVPFFTRPSVTERLNGVVQALAATEYDLIIHNVATPEQRESCFEALPTPDQVDGALVISLVPSEEEIARLETAEVPVVFIDVRHPGLEHFSQVYVDDVAGGRLATKRLLALGHTRIGFVGDRMVNPFNFTSSRDRCRGYREALRHAGVSDEPSYYVEGDHGRLEARALARHLLAQDERPTAILAASDTQAVGVLQAAADLGLDVPRELSVVGYDDIELAEIMEISTVRQMLFQSGKVGVEMLLNVLEDPEMEPVHTELPITFISRATTAPPGAPGVA
jgi:DNA-binding LacI/PurR family transcriptional regulator